MPHRHSDSSALRSAVDAALRPFVLVPPGGSMTVRHVAAAARDAAEAVVAALGEPARSADRVRRIVVPVLTCGWAEFDAEYAAALDAILALPPAIPGVNEPGWDAGLDPEPEARRSWLEGGQFWTPPADFEDTVAPGGTHGRVARRGRQSVLVTADGRVVRPRAHCTCPPRVRESREQVPFEQVHLRRDGSILDVTVGIACGTCRAAIT